ncbi:Protein of unknown function (DUF1399 [Striga hermonthica]|uniref:GRPD C-terminal domain-containing protein n=1 Tax=Striga hermonthica TaxID=68872 RepID=A0A9N7MW49_STRHE|nr:Protein of unknown function (DUF1399 [Striga hermonthica]
MSVSEGISSARSLSEVSEDGTVRFGIDLVAAARRNLGFLRHVSDSSWLHHESAIVEAIRRYHQLWMPLIADLTAGIKPPMILPPLDIEWVWFCHTLNPANYRNYCESRFSKIIGKPAIFDEENEEYALDRCREIWESKFQTDPFEYEPEPEPEPEHGSASVVSEDLFDMVWKLRNLYQIFSEPFYWEMVYLVAARQRYKGFIHMVHRFADECSSLLVPTSDVLLVWLTHQSYPTVYAADVNEFEGDFDNIVGPCETVKEEEIEQTKKLWEKIYDQPYEKAGGKAIGRPIITNEPPFYWDVTYADINTRYKSLMPRFLFEVIVSMKLTPNTNQTKKQNLGRSFLRLRMIKSHRELKLDTSPLSHFTSSATWQKTWHLYCEFGTKGLAVELRHRGGAHCSGGGSFISESSTFYWNDLLRAPSLALGQEMGPWIWAFASITPPVQGPYLLRCVPDRVTDDSGAMVSDVILKMNRYRPQEGRWLSRTVLDHAGRDCFVVRMRIGEGIWRRGGEAPRTVRREERIIEVCEGSWSYVAGSSSIGRLPAEKVVGTATPQEPTGEYQASWSFSTGHDLLIQWDPSGLRLDLQSKSPSEPTVNLLQGRKLQYQVMKSGFQTEENEFVTVARCSEENPTGKATALVNWKLQAMEVLPEEDSVLVILISMCLLRSVSELKREDVGNLLVRRRMREVKVGERDWGSVFVHPSCCLSGSTLHARPWYWDANAVMASQVRENNAQFVAGGHSSSGYSQVEGGDKLFRSGIIPEKIEKEK